MPKLSINPDTGNLDLFGGDTTPSPLTVPDGGTGATSFTDGGFLLGSGTDPITATAQPTDGQLPIGDTGADPILSTLTADNGVTVTNGSGSITIGSQVVQIIRSYDASGSQTSSTSFIDVTNASASITPTSASNDVFIQFTFNSQHGNIALSNVATFFQIFRDAVVLNAADLKVSGISSTGGNQHNCLNTYNFVDSPATTSSITYKLQQKINNAGTTMTTSEIQIVLTEII